MTMEQKFNALAAYVLAEGEEQKEITRKALNAAMRTATTNDIKATTDIENLIHDFLMELCADPALIGYKYVVFGIQSIIENPGLVDNLTYGFYPLIAVKFNTSAARVERSIRNVIERIFETASMETVHNFGFVVNAMNGKPTNGNFMARSALVIRARIKK